MRVERKARKKSTAASSSRCVKKKKKKKTSESSLFSALFPLNSHPCTHVSTHRDRGRQKRVSRRAPTREELPVFFLVMSFPGIVSRGVVSRSSLSLSLSLSFQCSRRRHPIRAAVQHHSYMSACRRTVAEEESEEPPREPDAIPPRAAVATPTLGDATTTLLLLLLVPPPRPDGDASEGDAQRASKADMAAEEEALRSKRKLLWKTEAIKRRFGGLTFSERLHFFSRPYFFSLSLSSFNIPLRPTAEQASAK